MVQLRKERIAGLDEQDDKEFNNPEISSSGSGTLFLKIMMVSEMTTKKSVVFGYLLYLES